MNQLFQGAAHQKYDKSLEEDMIMYDKQPYKKDPDLCNTSTVRLVSGNVMKYYTFQYFWNEPYLIDTQDEKVEKKLSAMRNDAEAAKQVYEHEFTEQEVLDEAAASITM
ncbi:MAG: hypothetical protein IKL07_09980 [Clostridium sp.]|nr:hypothetical protein [Clostridium sp.]